MSKDNITYEIVEKNEESPLLDKIVKKGIEVEFTMQELDDYTMAALSRLDEFRGQLNLEDAKMKNVEENHDDAIALVRELDPVKQNAIRIWLNSKNMVDTLAPKRDELEKLFEEHKAEIEEVKKQTKWKAPKQESHDNKKKSADEEGGESSEG